MLADLQPRLDGQALYDTDLGITWLADAGGAGSDRGLMNWLEAQNWVQAFSLGDATEWRLPATLNPDASCQDPATSSGFNCTGSEMGHLFYVELGGTANRPISDSTDPDVNLFSNLDGANWWSETSFTIPELAWDFRFGSGRQSASNKETFAFFAMAVHNGDVFAEPDTDGDGVADNEDNCLGQPNPDQRDSNGDGFGNRCDADLNNDCSVNFLDLAQMKSVIFSADPDADFDGDGTVNFVDLALMKSGFFMPPGPSGVANGC